jgi:hypothetical protein
MTDEPDEQPSATNITGRDHYIICKALAYAITAIERLPDRWQEASDKEDMRRLLAAMTEDPNHYFISARAHLERRGVTLEQGVKLRVADRPDGPVVDFPGDRGIKDA